jgi:tight adherence protein B
VDYLFYLFVLCAFLAVVLLFEGGFMLWNSYKGPEAKKIDQRSRCRQVSMATQVLLF